MRQNDIILGALYEVKFGNNDPQIVAIEKINGQHYEGMDENGGIVAFDFCQIVAAVTNYPEF